MSLPPPECTVYQNIYDHNKKHLDDIALLYFGKRISYRKMFAEIENAEKGFIAQGIKYGDNVALCVPATPEAIYSILALNKIGANANMLNPTFTTQQLIDRINETNATLLVVVNELYDSIKLAIPKTKIKTVIAYPAVNSLGTFIKVLKNAKNIPGTLSWADFIKQGCNTAPININQCSKNLPAIMVYSSGTTGASKGIQLTNSSINATICEGGCIGFKWTRQDRYFAQVPIWFSTGIIATILVPLRYGITVILEPLYNFEIFFKHIVKYKPNFMITAVGLIDYLVEKRAYCSAYRNFKYLVAGGEYVTSFTEEKINDWLCQNHAPQGLHKGYGMCECGGTVTASSYLCNAPGSAGIPTPHVVVSAFDLNSGKELTYRNRGELRVLTPCHMLGYYKNPEATASRLQKDEAGNVWVHTGDMGYVTEDGSVYVDGRLNDSFINEQGDTIYLFDIERALLRVEAVRQCKAVASNINGTQTLVVHASFYKGMETPETIIQQIKISCKEALPENHQPHLLKIYDALPVSPSGKLNTAQMKADIQNLITI